MIGVSGLENLSGSTQNGNLVVWFLPSPTGGVSDSINKETTYQNRSVVEVFNIRKEAHRLSHNPDCPQLNNEHLKALIGDHQDSGYDALEIG